MEAANMSSEKKKKEKKKKKNSCEDFQFCEVCRLNHDQGRRHRYFPAHLRALSALLSRFHSRLRLLLRHPSSSSSSPPPGTGFWCPFCALACGEDAISHLASEEHTKNLKHFLWKHGGGMDRLDSFRVSEADLIKWEKSCRSLNSEAAASSDHLVGPSPGPSKDIQFEHTTENADSFEKNSFQYFNSSVSHAVMPLQILTNEGQPVCHPKASRAATASSFPSFVTSLSAGVQGNGNLQDSCVFYSTGCQPTLVCDNRSSDSWSVSNGMEQRTDAGEDRSRGMTYIVLQDLTPMSSCFEGCQGNMHLGALPPWLEMIEENDRNLINNGPDADGLALPSSQKGKSKKLNPKRVGAAWAEKRRTELEMEKRGERVSNYCDANWLPNFGRVWQAGTRKESRKEFEMEKQKFFKEDNRSDLPVKVQPYISKRMRAGSP